MVLSIEARSWRLFGRNKLKDGATQLELGLDVPIEYEHRRGKKSGGGGRPARNTDSRGPIGGEMPVFGPDGGEVMATRTEDDGVTIFTEGDENHNRLDGTWMHRQDWTDLQENQPKPK
jgi:hypothetical protein